MNRLSSFLVILAALLLSGCVDVKEGKLDDGFGAIEGTVKDLRGSAVADALVYIQNDVSLLTSSRSDGIFLLQEVPAGIHAVIAVNPDGIGTSAQARVFAGETTSLNLVLTAGGSLTGVVTLEGEQEHAGTLVYLIGTSFAGYTDEDGSYGIDFIVPGCYTARAEHDGFYPKELERVCIEMGQQKNLQEITLLKHSLPDCMDDNDCEAHQVCVTGICSYEAGYSVEVCDGKDNDGDGFVDEGVAQPCGTSLGPCALGISLCLGGTMTECRGGVLPEDEICDFEDNDCDGHTDEDFDVDGDSYTSCGGDCDDNDPGANPSATEICDLVDNDCDGELDEGCPDECRDLLSVTVVAAPDQLPVAGAHVTVVDNSGAPHTADTNAGGAASFTNLAIGSRRSITVASDETVPPLPGMGGPDRPRYETTTVLGPCTDEITVPLRLTASGKAVTPMGTVSAKVPSSVFGMLPHAWKCAGDCYNDADCDETYYCELDETTPCGPIPANPGVGSCTPRALLPFFNLGDSNISGQFRVAMLVPVFPDADFTYRDLNKIFASPPGSEAIFPGNLAIDDTFMNGLAPSLGLDPWGDTCVRAADCPNTVDYVCEQDPQGDARCKDKNPLRNIEMLVPAGGNVKLAVVLGIIDVDMMGLLPVLLPFLTSDTGVGFDVGTFLAAFKMHTLHVCPITVNVTANTSNEITSALAGISKDDCWNVDYQQKDSTVALVDPTATGVDSCWSDADCCNTADPPKCGWPDSGKKCLDSPEDPGTKGCFMPLFRVEVVSGDDVTILPPTGGFDPTAPKSDARLCGYVPGTAGFEVMCLTATPNIYESCDPRDFRDLDIPGDHECSFTYGLALTALDFPVGHTEMPEGGRIFIGYDFNRCPMHYRTEPHFLVPFEVMDGNVGLSVTQMYFRGLARMGDGSFGEMPGYLTAQASSRYPVAALQLPGMVNLPALEPPPADAGFDVKITFEVEDPTVFPPDLKRVYATAAGMRLPVAGVHELTYDLTETTLAGEEMKGVVLSRVDYVDTVTYVDPWWRIYAPPGTESISLPVDASPFTSGESVWVTPFGSDLERPFRYDLFPVDAVLGPQRKYSEDSYAVIVP